MNQTIYFLFILALCQDMCAQEIFVKFPWLSEIVSTESCQSTHEIQEFDLETYSFVYIRSELGNKLYFEDGALFCSDSENYNCRLAYGLNERFWGLSWKCDEQNSTQLTEKDILIDGNPWLLDVIDDCNYVSIKLYVFGTYYFIYINRGNSSGELYYQDGTFYCSSTSTYNCLEAYQINEESSLLEHYCDIDSSTVEIDSSIASLFTDYPWLLEIVDTVSCSSTEISEFVFPGYAFLLVEVDDQPVLYNQDGLLYCTSQGTLDCVAAYNLMEENRFWTCSDGQVASDGWSKTFGEFREGYSQPKIAKLDNNDYILADDFNSFFIGSNGELKNEEYSPFFNSQNQQNLQLVIDDRFYDVQKLSNNYYVMFGYDPYRKIRDTIAFHVLGEINMISASSKDTIFVLSRGGGQSYIQRVIATGNNPIVTSLEVDYNVRRIQAVSGSIVIGYDSSTNNNLFKARFDENSVKYFEDRSVLIGGVAKKPRSENMIYSGSATNFSDVYVSILNKDFTESIEVLYEQNSSKAGLPYWVHSMAASENRIFVLLFEVEAESEVKLLTFDFDLNLLSEQLIEGNSSISNLVLNEIGGVTFAFGSRPDNFEVWSLNHKIRIIKTDHNGMWPKD